MTENHGSVPDLESLVREHHQDLYRYAYRLSGSSSDAEDLTQQTYLIAHQRLEQVREPSRIRFWLLKILRNAFLKTQKKKQELLQENLDYHPNEESETPTLVDPEELQLILNDVPEEFRTPLIFYYFRELSYKEIAEVMECPIGTVMSRLSRGKEILRTRLRQRMTQFNQ